MTVKSRPSIKQSTCSRVSFDPERLTLERRTAADTSKVGESEESCRSSRSRCLILEVGLAMAVAKAKPTSKIRHLDLLDLQLSSLSPTLLVSAAVRLSKVNLSGSKLTREQVDCLMEGLDFTVMRDLNLDYVLLSSCAPETLATVVASLQTASLKKCGLTETQVCHLLTALVHQSTSLTALCLHGNSLTETQVCHLLSSLVHQSTS